MTLQNGTQYELWLARDDGTRLAVLDNVGPFSFTSVLNNVGHFAITLPENFDRSLIAVDRRVLIWRRPVGGAMYLAFEGLIVIPDDDDSSGNMQRTIEGVDLNDLLRRRIVAYAANSAQAAMTAAADTMMAEIVKDNLGSDATAARQISSTYFSVAASPGAGPSLTKAFAYRIVLDVLRELADAARDAGTETYFGIVPTTETAFEFRTKTVTWGRDRTADSGNGLIFGKDFGNLAGGHLRQDHSDEVNVAYGLGRGDDDARDVQTSEDTTRARTSIFARREAGAPATMETTSAGYLDVADARVAEGRPVTTFTARLLSVPGAVYGLDWGLGDLVTATFDGRQFDAMIRAVTVNVEADGNEVIDVPIEARL